VTQVHRVDSPLKRPGPDRTIRLAVDPVIDEEPLCVEPFDALSVLVWDLIGRTLRAVTQIGLRSGTALAKRGERCVVVESVAGGIARFPTSARVGAATTAEVDTCDSSIDRLVEAIEDIRQLGADAVIGRDGTLRYPSLTSTPEARPPISELIAALD
jgi:hypothetical protein